MASGVRGNSFVLLQIARYAMRQEQFDGALPKFAEIAENTLAA